MRSQSTDLRELPDRFRRLSPAGRVGVSVLAAVGISLITFAERDLQVRPAAQVRGAKLIWRLVCLNVVGALAYLLWGRRPQ